MCTRLDKPLCRSVRPSLFTRSTRLIATGLVLKLSSINQILNDDRDFITIVRYLLAQYYLPVITCTIATRILQVNLDFCTYLCLFLFESSSKALCNSQCLPLLFTFQIVLPKVLRNSQRDDCLIINDRLDFYLQKFFLQNLFPSAFIAFM